MLIPMRNTTHEACTRQIRNTPCIGNSFRSAVDFKLLLVFLILHTMFVCGHFVYT